MYMIINNGIAGSTRTQLQTTANAIAKSLKRLSTGKRVNSSQDDQAAYSIGTKLESQSRGLLQAIDNVNHALGMVQTAEGAIDTQINIVVRMREIAIEASNGMLSVADRTNLNNELSALYAEFSRITNATEFNGTKLIDGSFGTKTIQAGANFDQNLNSVFMAIGDLSAGKQFVKTIGSGTFQAAVTSSLGTTPDAVKLVDVNGDGKLDAVNVDSGDGMVSVALGNKNGTFQVRSTYAVGTTPVDLAVGDFNGDGIMDIVTADTANTVSILTGKGDGTFNARTTKTVGGNATGVAVGDFNADGYLDIVTANGSAASASILLGNGDGTFQTATSLTTESNANKIVVTDLNNDNKLDIVTTDNSGTISIFIGAGTGSFASRVTKSTGTTPMGITAGKLNSDGSVDLVVTNSGTTTASVFINNNDGTGGMAAKVDYTVKTAPRNVSIGDINGDGINDLVVSNFTTGQVSLLTGTGSGTYNTQSNITATAARGLDVGDIDGDGVLDIVTTNRTSGLLNVSVGYTNTVTAGTSIDVSSQTNAQSLLTILDNTLTSLKGEQAKLTGIHSRLDQAAAANLLLKDSYDSAKSDIIDADVAMDAAELVKNQILAQAQTAVLAQANVQMQVVLGLLR
ncbi:MAG: VCBS repeat-containing protein [Deltaproteobacteria bacterium]|nr:VCBS repeat-containing protein [Deltaproteobacteria bacterium]